MMKDYPDNSKPDISGHSKSGKSKPEDMLKMQPDSNTHKSAAQKPNMDFILDVPLEISVELGRTSLIINDLLKLGQGSIVELSKIAGETLEVLANQRLIARGEVVVVNDKYGIRLTEIISPMERIERLK